MRVALVNPPLTGHLARGTGVYLRNLEKALGKYTDVEVVTTAVHSLPQDVDLYHFPYFDPFFRTIPWRRSKPTVVTIHDLIPLLFPEHFPVGVKGKINWRLTRQIVRSVDAVMTDSSASAKDIQKLIGLPNDKIQVVYLAPGEEYRSRITPEVKNKVKRKYNLPDSFALFVGDVNWNKNLINVIYAATLASVQLVVVSRVFAEDDQTYHPWKKHLIEAQTAARNNPFVHKIGYADETDLPAIYQLATVLVAPSYYEGFGLPVVEAFTSGCPVITSQNSALVEVAGRAAEFVNPSRIQEIAAAISTVFKYAQIRQKLSRLGKDQVKKFSWKKSAHDVLGIYKQLLLK